MTKFYSFLNRKNKFLTQRKNQTGFGFLPATLKSEDNWIIPADKCHYGLKIKNQAKLLNKPSLNKVVNKGWNSEVV